MSWWRNILKVVQTDDTHEFQPGLVEIEQDPGSPLARITFWLVVLFMVFAVSWTIFGKVDVVVTGRGKVIPEGNVKELQPLEAGMIKEILVTDGDYVEAGQPLMIIDTSVTEPTLASEEQNLTHLQLEAQRLEANIRHSSFQPDRSLVNTPDDNASLLTQQSLHRALEKQQQQQLSEINQQLAQLGEQEQSLQLQLNNAKELLTIAKEDVTRLEPVADIIPKQDWLKAKQTVLTQGTEVSRLSHELSQIPLRQQQLIHQRSKVQADFTQQRLTELSEKQKQIQQLTAKRQTTAFSHDKHQLKAPVAGYVQDIKHHTIGGVVTPAEVLMKIVPTEHNLLIKAELDSQDIGFVSPEMPVNIKVDTFSFQKYGTLDGVVKSISKDTTQKPSDPSQQIQIYTVYIRPTETQLMVEGKEQSLQTGMTVTADIKVGKRRIIEFFIYPMIKYLNEGISVR